jgi:anaerobic ribonucleoside-triphosphate reductase activating protein
MLINLHSLLQRSTENGPGTRAVLWVQGCTLACPGCFNPDTHAMAPRTLITVADLAENIGQISGIEGITISGGEPFLQADALAELGRLVRRQNRGIVIFSGFTFDQLARAKNPRWDALLACIDLLIAGPFMQERACQLPLRGSSNQTLHFLTDRYASYRKTLETSAHGVEVLIDRSGQIVVTGFPDQDLW